ncbi:hypothetical protein E2562_020423 [Oryza meyeriana var. granulata]|uniref:Uncharacterized protein n=1 Tax=Oryza meyeriana var. granulata TaxID=110450 RepID=A0A6G1D441_9ORYZ|nr:hypothetical protein E2562_020423 [Oryza meyeriana var. granulata]
MTPLQSLPLNPEEETLLSEYYQLASLYLSSSAGVASVIVPTPMPKASAGRWDDKRAEALGLTGIGGFTAVDHRRVCADLRAVALMGDRDLWLNHDRRIVGPIAKESG